MSEYQYHEWQTVDRLLSLAEQAAVNKLSSHIAVSPGKAVVTYNWGDFKHDPQQVLLRYFDAYFYQANWGSVRLMFRFPKGMLEEDQIEPFLDGEYVSFDTVGDYQVLDINFNPEDGGWLEETGLDLSDFIPLRAALLQGDYRLLYLAWLKEMTFFGEPSYDEGEDSRAYDIEPPVPPNLKKLTPALENFKRMFDIDPFLVQAAAEASQDLEPAPLTDYQKLVSRLSRTECDDFLTRLANGDATAGMALRKRLDKFSPQSQPARNAGKRSIGELVQRSHQLNEADKRQKAEEARMRHIVEMKELARREPHVWQEVDRLLETGQKSAAAYDQVTAQLDKLKQLAEFQDTLDPFFTRVRTLAEKYSSRTSLLRRWREQGWI
jgi:hypothetical protein